LPNNTGARLGNFDFERDVSRGWESHPRQDSIVVFGLSMKIIILVFSLLSVVASEAQSITPHPRIWLTSQMISDMTAKKVASDPDWVAIKAAADTILTQTLPKLTIISATNANPVVFTTAEALPWNGAAPTVYLTGGAGAWAAVNNNPNTVAWTATATGSNTFTIPVDSTAFGSFAGQSLTFFMAGGENNSGFLSYGQTGSGFYDAFLQLGLVYRITGTTAYATKAITLLDWINTLGAAGLISPVSQDSGRASMGATLGVAIAYDWFYDLLSPAEKASTAVTLNLWNAWTQANAFSTTDPQSNYWEGHVTASAASGYATYGDNSNSQALINWATNNWSTNFDPKFFNPPSTTAKAVDDPSGYFYGGLAILGYNYGGNDISRHLKYMLLVKTATGTDMLATRDYGRRWARNLIYSMKPDRWHVPPLGQWPGSWYGVVTLTEAVLLSYTLEGTTEGGWAQWLYQNMGAYPADAATFVLPNVQDRFMFAKASRTAIDYRTTQPPYYFSDGGEAQVFLRSNWSDTADYAFVNVADSHYTGITPKHGGHVDLTRGSDYLLVASGHWKGSTGDGTVGSPENGAQSSAMQSTLYFWDGGTTNGGKCFNQDATYDGCQLGFGIYKSPIIKLTPDFAFMQNDFATSYDFTQVPAARTLQYFFRSFLSLGDGTYIVWDRAQSTSATHTKQLRWHLSAATIPNLNGDTIVSTVGNSKIFIKTLLPASPRISIVRNLTAVGAQPLNWRAEVTDSSPATILNGLTVLYTAPSSGSLPPTSTLTTDSGHVGVQIAGAAPKVAVIPLGALAVGDGTFNPATYVSVTFTSTHAGTAKYLVAGLAAGTYAVVKDGVPLSGLTAAIVDSAGVLYFVSNAGSFSITSGVAPPSVALGLSCPAVTSGQSGSLFTAGLLAGGGTAPYTYSIFQGNLPPGLTLSGSTGQITGTPTTSGSYTYTAAVRDSAANTATASCSISITAPPPINTGGTYACTNNQFSLSNDIVLGNGDSVDLIGTSGAHCTVTGNGHRFIVADASWTGHFKMRYADVFDLGSSTLDILGGTNSGDYAYIGGSGYVDIQQSTFSRSSGFNLLTGGSSFVVFSYNTYNSDNLVSTDNAALLSRPWLKEWGTSTAPKYFQGNRIYMSYIDVGSPNWLVGADRSCASSCDTYGNIFIGKRAGMAVRGSGSFVSYNYSHVTLDLTPAFPTWSQVYNLQIVGAGVIVENNIFRSGDWVANGIDGELRNNVLLELNPHNFVRIGSGGLIHHNILLTLYPGLDRYDISSARMSIGEAAFGLPQAGNSLSIYNNTLDARGAAVKTVLSAVDGATVTSFRNNVSYRLKLLATDCPTGADCTSAVGASGTEGFVSPPPPRALYMDYNGFYFDSSSLRQITYDIGIAGKTVCQPGWGGHDLGTCPNGSMDPLFRGPLPLGSGQTGYGSPNDSGFPFNDSDILAGTYPVSAMLSYFRWVYAPQTGSPLMGAQDPQDGPGDIGAVQTAALPAQAPSIVTTNKRPMVYGGPALNISSLTTPAKLSGYAADDGLPSNRLTLQWTMVSGPGTVTFADATMANTTATFSANGIYILRLTGNDGSLSSTYDVVVNVGGSPTPLATCDLNGDGVVDSKDIAIFSNMAIGLAPLDLRGDLNGDGVVNIIDVQRDIIAAMGGACKTGR
jgi:hypothetical protein